MRIQCDILGMYIKRVICFTGMKKKRSFEKETKTYTYMLIYVRRILVRQRSTGSQLNTNNSS